MNIIRRIPDKQIQLLFIAAFSLFFLALGVAYAAKLQGIKDPQRAAYYNTFKNKEVVFVPVFMGLPLTEGWSKMMKMQAKALGYKYEVRNANFNTKAGTQILTSLINAKHKPDVIVVHNPDVTSYMRLEKKAEKEGIYVVQLNMHSLAQTTGFAGGDAVRIGAMQAKAVVNHCGADTDTSHQVLILTGPTTAPWSVYLQQGYKQVLSKHPVVKIVSVQSTGNYEADKAKKITHITLQQHPKLCAVIGVWDIPDTGTAAAIKEAGKKGKVYLVTNGAGNASVGCKYIKNGSFNYYVSFNLPGQGRDINDLIEIALEEKAQGIKPGTTHFMLYSPLRVLTKESIKRHPCWTLKDMRY
jgi:ribose transport system substrate-binding protein